MSRARWWPPKRLESEIFTSFSGDFEDLHSIAPLLYKTDANRFRSPNCVPDPFRNLAAPCKFGISRNAAHQNDSPFWHSIRGSIEVHQSEHQKGDVDRCTGQRTNVRTPKSSTYSQTDPGTMAYTLFWPALKIYSKIELAQQTLSTTIN